MSKSGTAIPTRLLFAGLIAMSAVVIPAPAWAKVDIVGADITGPGLKGGVKIGADDRQGLWDSGIDIEGGLDDGRADWVEELGLTSAHLGPRYLVTYRFGIGRARQHLYPYAQGRPVTYTPPGQKLGRGRDLPNFLRNRPVSAGWYQSSRGFFDYLVDHGLPQTAPSCGSGLQLPGLTMRPAYFFTPAAFVSRTTWNPV